MSEKGDTIVLLLEGARGLPHAGTGASPGNRNIVDKSRSKKPGGAGPGLSIVKHIVLLHGSTIEVKRDIRKRTTFTITIPANPAR